MLSSEEEADLNFTVNEDNEHLNPEREERVIRADPDVGIESLAQQYVNRVLKTNCFSFNIMLLGQTGVGKSTLIDSLFRVKFNDNSCHNHCLSEVEVVSNYYHLYENDIHIELDKPYEPIAKYLDKQMEEYLDEELKIERRSEIKDTRVHACLYLISPVGHGLKEIDLVTMKELDTKVNIIPVIAKSDLITRSEMIDLKRKIMSEMDTNSIGIYRFPVDDPQVAQMNGENNSLLPFAVVASNQFITIGDREVRSRQYPWGTVEVENESHSDLIRLRDMLLRVNMNDLKERTHSQHYEIYRSERLDQYWKERQRELSLNMKREENELITRYKNIFSAKDVELKNMENELHRKYEKMHKHFIEGRDMLEAERVLLEEDIMCLNRRKQLLRDMNIRDAREYQIPKNPKSPNNPKSKSK
ncbi:unnamed protein product [Oppiella nova]|uniref:Septin n=1 Tax=Oppiella nova TaxID=334625 RepID=A0A7R9QIM4_9ACAR|nr:unnamed protein product [Oppiella nova]CAG2166708.1 unnamed protein product [Oppiella nova]